MFTSGQERARDAENKLKELLGTAPRGTSIGDLERNQGQAVRVTSDENSNRVFVSAPPSKLEQAKRALEEMDVPQKGQTLIHRGPLTYKTYRAPAKNAEALVKSVKELYAKSPDVAIAAVGRDAVMVKAFPADHAIIAKLIESSLFSDGSTDELTTELIMLDTLTPKRAMDSLNTLFDRSRGGPVPILAANLNENALIVRGTPEQIKVVKEALKKLDAGSMTPGRLGAPNEAAGRQARHAP